MRPGRGPGVVALDAFIASLRAEVAAPCDAPYHCDARPEVLPTALRDDLRATLHARAAEVFADVLCDDGFDDGELPTEDRGASLVCAPLDPPTPPRFAAPNGLDAVLAAARAFPPSAYLSEHLRAQAIVDPAAVEDVLRRGALSGEERAMLARELGVRP